EQTQDLAAHDWRAQLTQNLTNDSINLARHVLLLHGNERAGRYQDGIMRHLARSRGHGRSISSAWRNERQPVERPIPDRFATPGSDIEGAVPSFCAGPPNGSAAENEHADEDTWKAPHCLFPCRTGR